MTSFQWRHYIEVAQQLIDIPSSEMSKSSEEAFYRSAASRAYYAAYKTSNDWVDVNIGIYTPAPGASSHQDFIDYIEGTIKNQSDAFTLKKRLMQLKTLRMAADYTPSTITNPWDRGRAELAISVSEKACNQLTTCLPK